MSAPFSLLPFQARPGPAPQGPETYRLAAGRLHEAWPAGVHDAPARGFLLGAARALAPRLVLWIREAPARAEAGAIYAPGLARFGIDPAAIVMVAARRRMEALWAAEEGLKQAGVLALVELGARDRPIDLTITRRLALAAETHGSTALVLRGDIGRGPAPPSAAWTRWRIAPAASRSVASNEIGAPAFAAELIRHRGGSARPTFFLEWSNDAFHEFGRTETLGGDLARTSVDGSAGAPRRAAG